MVTDTELIGTSARVTVSFTVGWTISDSFLGPVFGTEITGVECSHLSTKNVQF